MLKHFFGIYQVWWHHFLLLQPNNVLRESIDTKEIIYWLQQNFFKSILISSFFFFCSYYYMTYMEIVRFSCCWKSHFWLHWNPITSYKTLFFLIIAFSEVGFLTEHDWILMVNVMWICVCARFSMDVRLITLRASLLNDLYKLFYIIYINQITKTIKKFL